jgi:hypothetical protein
MEVLMPLEAIVMSVVVPVIFCTFAGVIVWVDRTQPKEPKPSQPPLNHHART